MNIAIVKLSAMGDIIHAMVALQYMKQKYPGLKIDWIVENSFVKVLENNPHIDNILAVNLKAIKKDKKQFFKQLSTVRKYANKKYDLVIDAQGLFKSAMVAKLLGKKIAGFSKSSIRESIASYFYTQKVDISYDANTIDRNAKVMAEPLGIEITPKMIHEKETFLFYKETQRLQHEILRLLNTEKKNIIFVIGSTWESRNYPKEKFAQVANSLEHNILIAWGNEEERKKAKWIASQSTNVTVLPQMNLNELKAVIANADLLIGNDTGPTHMAWGLNIPSITLFGPTPTNRVYETLINRVIASSSVVNHYKLNKNDFSIAEIEVKDVVAMAESLLYG